MTEKEAFRKGRIVYDEISECTKEDAREHDKYLKAQTDQIKTIELRQNVAYYELTGNHLAKRLTEELLIIKSSAQVVWSEESLASINEAERVMSK